MNVVIIQPYVSVSIKHLIYCGFHFSRVVCTENLWVGSLSNKSLRYVAPKDLWRWRYVHCT